MTEASPAGGEPPHDWQAVLHEEVDRLPDRYRLPVVLCYLEGQSHAEAARSLGWPLGTVKGRLARARAQLRGRLARRGVTLSVGALAGAVAVPPALLGQTLRGAVAFAARGAAAGGASARAVALAKGALQTMTASRLSVTASVLLLAGLIGAGGLFAVPSGGERLAAAPERSAPPALALLRRAPAPVQPRAPQPGAAVVEKGGVRFEFLVAERVWAIPENRPRAHTPVKMELRLTNRTKTAVRLCGFRSVALEMVGPDGKALRMTTEGADGTYARREANCPLVGPGESVTFPWTALLASHNDRPHLAGWGPLFEWTNWDIKGLGPGDYQLRLHYRNPDSTFTLSMGDPPPVLTNVWTGEVTPPAVKVSLVEALRAPAPRAPVPPADEFGPEVKGLRARVTLPRRKFRVDEPIVPVYAVKNVSRTDQVLYHSGFWPNHQVLVRDSAGREPVWTDEGQRRRAAFSPGGERDKNAPWTLKPGGVDATEGRHDLTRLHNLSLPGRYTVQYVYEEKQAGGWQGRLPSNVAAFEILPKADLKVSRAVRVNGVDFQAVAEPKYALPLPGERRPVDVGLRLTNAGKKALLFNLYDTIRPTLRSADGKVIGGVNRRLRTFLPAPALVGPGKTETVWRRAHQTWTSDRARLLLLVPDGAGGAWNFDGLPPGKYRLSFEYENTEAALARFQRPPRKKEPYEQGQPFWMGKATTDEVEFEVLPSAR